MTAISSLPQNIAGVEAFVKETLETLSKKYEDLPQICEETTKKLSDFLEGPLVCFMYLEYRNWEIDRLALWPSVEDLTQEVLQIDNQIKEFVKGIDAFEGIERVAKKAETIYRENQEICDHYHSFFVRDQENPLPEFNRLSLDYNQKTESFWYLAKKISKCFEKIQDHIAGIKNLREEFNQRVQYRKIGYTHWVPLIKIRAFFSSCFSSFLKKHEHQT